MTFYCVILEKSDVRHFDVSNLFLLRTMMISKLDLHEDSKINK